MRTDNTSDGGSKRMDRRKAIKWMATAAASAWLFDRNALAGEALVTGGKGYGQDPDLLKTFKPGDLWPLTLTPAQRSTVSALCDVIIPADAKSPSASAVGVPDFIDEWISAPYPGHADDRRVILDGIEWIEGESHRRFQNGFSTLVSRQKNAIAADIASTSAARGDWAGPARFFQRFRDLTAGGFYTTNEGMKDIGYTGNVPLAQFDGPPLEVLRAVGLA